MQKSTSLKYGPSPELLLITAKQLFFNRELYLAVQLSVHVPVRLADVMNGRRIILLGSTALCVDASVLQLRSQTQKCFICSPFHGRACRWAMLGASKPKGPKGPKGKAPGLTKSVGPKGLRPRYRGTSLIRNTPLPGPYSRTIPRVIWWS